ncbi:hypothetical protein BH09ACT6_BH09ACT6_05670 [soil metagenome]
MIQTQLSDPASEAIVTREDVEGLAIITVHDPGSSTNGVNEQVPRESRRHFDAIGREDSVAAACTTNAVL